MLFVRRGSLLLQILPQLLVIFALSIGVVIFHGELLNRKITLTAVPFSLVGVALAIFLGFRNSASYDRYWEARKLWGKLLTDGRNAARQYASFISSEIGWPSSWAFATAPATTATGKRANSGASC